MFKLCNKDRQIGKICTQQKGDHVTVLQCCDAFIFNLYIFNYYGAFIFNPSVFGVH